MEGVSRNGRAELNWYRERGIANVVVIHIAHRRQPFISEWEVVGTKQGAMPVCGWGEHRLVRQHLHVGCARAFARVLGGKRDALPLAEHLENGAPDSTPMEEMLRPALVAYEPEPFVDQQPRNGPFRHTDPPDAE